MNANSNNIMFAFRGSPDAQDDRSDERCATKERQATNEAGSRMALDGWNGWKEGGGGGENSINSMEGVEKICKHAGTQKVPKC